MPFPAQAFREYDIRGVADRDLTDEVARGIGHGFASMIGAGDRDVRIAVGRDCRLSSDRLLAALIDGLTGAGAQVVEVGVGPTPMLYGSVHALATDGGVMITGSHNPGDENGFKMMRGKASFFGADIQELRKQVEDGATSRWSRAGSASRGRTSSSWSTPATAPAAPSVLRA
jgi:phosphomannomutase/phosphoglucomutase